MKITRRQLNRLIRENLGLETNDRLAEWFFIGPVLGAAGLGMGKVAGAVNIATVAYYADDIIKGLERMKGFTPQDHAKVLLDPKNPLNPVTLMKPLEKLRADRGAKKIEKGIKGGELIAIAQKFFDALDGFGVDEEGIENAINMCKSRYEIAQVAHYFMDNMKQGNLQDKIYSGLTESEYTRHVAMQIDKIDAYMTLTYEGRVVSYTQEEFLEQVKKDYKKAKLAFPKAKKDQDEGETDSEAEDAVASAEADSEQMNEASDLPKSAKSRLRGQMDRHLAAGSGRFQAHFRIEDDPNSKFVNISDVEADESSDHPKTSDLLGVLNSNMAKALLKDVPPGKYKIAVAI